MSEVGAVGSWGGANLSFWLITISVLVSAGFAAFSRNIVRAAFSLFFTLFGMAGYYVLLGSEFVAITQVIIYVGGILVLLMFGILLTNRLEEPIEAGFSKEKVAALVLGALFFGALLFVLVFKGHWTVLENLPEPAVTVRELGHALLGNYLLALEAVGMTLLLCLIGAAYLVRRKER